MIRIDVIDTFSAVQRLEQNWNEVYDADPDAQFFLSWRWLSGWLGQIVTPWLILAALLRFIFGALDKCRAALRDLIHRHPPYCRENPPHGCAPLPCRGESGPGTEGLRWTSAATKSSSRSA